MNIDTEFMNITIERNISQHNPYMEYIGLKFE